MLSNKKLFSIGIFEFRIYHLLIIFILTISCTISFLLRSLPADFMWELHEFDPFYNYRATEFLVNNGLDEYLKWNDELSWYPIGRDVAGTSQVILHLTTGSIYLIFSDLIDLYDFTILFPAVIGSLTSIVIFGLVRTISGTTTSGLIASMLFAVSFPILIRGQIGWFKSEPLGIFLGILGTYLFLNCLSTKNQKKLIIKSFLSGLFLSLGISAWGGDIFFLIPLAILFCILPFIKKDHNFLILSIVPCAGGLFITSLLFDSLSEGFNFLFDCIPLLVSVPIMISIIMIQKISKPKFKNRNGMIFFCVIILISTGLIIFNDDLNLIPIPTHRYLNSVFPLLTTTDPLTDSVSEHQTLNIYQSFQFHSVLLIFASIGLWLILQNSKRRILTNEMFTYTLCFSMFGVYIGSAFMRLEVFTSIGIILLSSIGIGEIIKLTSVIKLPSYKKIFFYSSSFFIIFLLIIPFFLPTQSNILTLATTTPPTISNGGTNFIVSTNDWKETLEWIKINTPENSVIGSWWDYGYWIQTLGNRPSIADNSTLIDHRIKTIAKIMFETPDDAWKSLSEIEADYFIIFISGEKTVYSTVDGKPLYVLYGGGDESKKYWFAKVAGIELSKYLESDWFSGTNFFWENTFLASMIPFELLGYVNIQSDQISESFIPGWTAVYFKENKFNYENSPFKLVYSSSSYDSDTSNTLIGIFVYEVNKEYRPINLDWESPVIEYNDYDTYWGITK